MKNIGIIRRLDALGRIVIPREYRKMNRIELGDPLEIRALDNGEIVLKKVDLDAELVTFGLMVATAANAEIGKTIMVCSPKQWLIGVGAGKQELIGNVLPEQLTKSIQERREYNGKTAELSISFSECFIATPIMGDLDCFGAIAIFSADKITKDEISLAKTLAAIIGNNLQRY